MNFNEVKEDYRVCANTNDIDIVRILRECSKEEGSEYVVVSVPISNILFMTKKFSNRVKALGLFDFNAISDDKMYGFNDGVSTGNLVPGNKIRSVGFTYGIMFEYSVYDNVVNKLKNIDAIEKEAAESLAKEKENYVTVKVISG